jgi:hypothetical protein
MLCGRHLTLEAHPNIVGPLCQRQSLCRVSCKQCSELPRAYFTPKRHGPSVEVTVLAVPCIKAMLALSAASAFACTFASPAEATEREWLPRRHFRRIDDPRERRMATVKGSKVEAAAFCQP